MTILYSKQKEKLGNVINGIESVLSKKVADKNSKPVFIRVNMANGGFRSIEEFTQETVCNIQL